MSDEIPSPESVPVPAPPPFAVVDTGGRQIAVRPGDVVDLDLRSEEPGATITFESVCLVQTGDQVAVGAPYVAGARVTAVVKGAVKGPKLISHKYRRRKGSRSRRGHRQRSTRVEITAING